MTKSKYPSGDPRALITAIGAELAHQRLSKPGGDPLKRWAYERDLDDSTLGRLERGLRTPSDLEGIVDVYAKFSEQPPAELWRKIIERFIEARYVTGPARVKRAGGRGRGPSDHRKRRGQSE